MKISPHAGAAALLLLLLACAPRCAAQPEPPPKTPRAAGPPVRLATETFTLKQAAEVGLEIEARSPGASWAREGAEAAALVVSLDGAYNQDLLLWAGGEMFRYRVALGRLPAGRHTVSVALNPARSAAGARRAEVAALRTLPASPAPPGAAFDEDAFALAHSPVLYARPNTIDRFTDIPLLLYYEVLRDAGDTVIRYTVVFTNEDGGTQTAALLARWGRATDIEWVYQVRVRNSKIVEEIYQGVKHETKFFAGARTGGGHPLLAVASDNNNFSDLATSAVRYAPLPSRADLAAATRESVMDAQPVTYRVMTEELRREGRISPTPADINTIADPREYLYVEAASTQEGSAVSFDVRLAGRREVFATDMNDPRLRIERGGYFRTSVRLPAGAAPSEVETVTARCHAHTTPFAGERRCKNLRLVRLLVLDENYVPRTLSLQPQREVTLAAGESKTYKINQP